MQIPSQGKLLVYGPAMLNVVSEEVLLSDLEDLSQLEKVMYRTMQAFEGIGLAACQVGVFKRIVVIEMREGGYLTLLNPEVVGMRGKELLGPEGCLSIPPKGNECLVFRMAEVDIQFRSSNYELKCMTFRGRDAIVMQHEIDHLDGTFFIERARPTEKSKVVKKFNTWKTEKTMDNKGKKKKLPQTNPLLAPNAVCPTCGDIIEPTVVKAKLGVQYVEYKHTNEEFGCAYAIRNIEYLRGDIRNLNADEQREALPL